MVFGLFGIAKTIIFELVLDDLNTGFWFSLSHYFDFFSLMRPSLTCTEISLNLIFKITMRTYKIQIQHFDSTLDIMSASFVVK